MAIWPPLCVRNPWCRSSFPCHPCDSYIVCPPLPSEVGVLTRQGPYEACRNICQRSLSPTSRLYTSDCSSIVIGRCPALTSIERSSYSYSTPSKKSLEPGTSCTPYVVSRSSLLDREPFILPLLWLLFIADGGVNMPSAFSFALRTCRRRDDQRMTLLLWLAL